MTFFEGYFVLFGSIAFFVGLIVLGHEIATRRDERKKLRQRLMGK